MTLEIHIDDMVYQEVMHYVNASDFEVSGLHQASRQPERLRHVRHDLHQPNGSQ